MLNPRKTFVIIVAAVVGALHFIIGPDYSGPFPLFARGYLIDILLPFFLYFLIALPGMFRSRMLIAALVVLIGAAVESLQFLGFPVLGSTFDPLDYVMYALGAVLGLLTDIFWFSKLKSAEK